MKPYRTLALRLMLLPSLALWALAGMGATERFALQINDASGLRENWPLVGGLPFAEGQLHDPDSIRILDADGNAVPAQIDIAATWRDGSIRWALAGFNAAPSETYAVAFGAAGGAISRQRDAGIRVDEQDGRLRIDTGAAVYAFLPDRLLPETVQMAGHTVLEGAGEGAYLVDQRGRLARVAGDAAEISASFVRRGDRRVVLLREGWYVTGEGERLARARAWFYFMAGSPYLRITHSLVLTEDTNDLWIRDYGLEFRTPQAPEQVTFAVDTETRDPETLLTTLPVRANAHVTLQPGADEVFMLQDQFPVFLEREAFAVIGQTPSTDVAAGNTFWTEDWKQIALAAGDWGDAAYETHGLTVVMPWMAHQFPKEIAFDPEGARVAFWSGRTGRELDFRGITLVNEYWQGWASRAVGGATALADSPSNAQCAARTHDVWLLPRHRGDDLETVRARADAASQPPLVLADPAWLTATEAVGWPMHPEDFERFPEEEEVLSTIFDRLMERHEALRRTGLIDWGAPPLIRGAGGFFRVSGLVDYGLRRHAWSLFARSGDRRYYHYGSRFNRFAADWSVAHWDVGRKFKGGFANARDYWGRPMYWGEFSQLEPVGGTTGHDIVNWMLEHYLTGDEYALEITRMHGEAYKAHWETTARHRSRYDGIHQILRVMANLYALEWDETFGDMAHELARYVIDLEVPNAISDAIRFGSLYKVDRNLISLYYYYRETGDALAREAFLRGIDVKYRFNRVGSAFGGQSYPSFLFSVAYRMTGNSNYLRVVHSLLNEHRRWSGNVAITSQINPTMGAPVALAVAAESDQPVEPFPLLRQYAEPDPSRLLLRKPADRAVTLRLHLRMSNRVRANAETTARFSPHPAAPDDSSFETLPLRVETMQTTERSSRTDTRRRYVELDIPAEKPEGLYVLQFPDIDYVDVLESDATELSVFAPEGFRTLGSRSIDTFPVGAHLEHLRLFLGVPTTILRPDGSVALDADDGLIGVQSLEVLGQGGAWSLHPRQSGIVRLLNTEPLFSRVPERLVSGANVMPAPRFEAPSDALTFVPGRQTQALHLPSGQRLTFPRGDETPGGYAHFPGSEGTVEFWFRPNWSSTELPYGTGLSLNDRFFLRAGSHALQYRRGRDRAGEVASLNLWAYGRDSNAGFTGRFWFDAGAWVHLAFTWRTLDGMPGTDGHYAVFVNGEPLTADPARPGGSQGTDQHWPGRVSGDRPFSRREASETISLGPLDGTIENLRISSVVRYTEAFGPPEMLPPPDAHTCVQFALDGDYQGQAADGQTVTLTP